MPDAGLGGRVLCAARLRGDGRWGGPIMDDDAPVAVMVMFPEPTEGWPDGDAVYGPMCEAVAYRLMVDAAQAGAVHAHTFPLLPTPERYAQ